MNKTIYLLKIGKVPQSILLGLMKNLDIEFKEFNIKVEILKEGIKLRKKYFNSIRNQYKAIQILNILEKKAKNWEIFKLLGITGKDIYSKDKNFIFGLAKRGSYAALISLPRLRENFYIESGTAYRKTETKEDFNTRVLKEAKHELGHTFGLKHCHNTCVMQFSNSLADTDKKPVEFCETCITELKILLS
ncbi:MAG: archaemetzincin family Zn-dependent metalloprotease [Promethearchaeota archaeon]